MQRNTIPLQRNTKPLSTSSIQVLSISTTHFSFNPHPSFHPTPPINKPLPPTILFKLKSQIIAGIFEVEALSIYPNALYTHFISKTFSFLYILKYIQGFCSNKLSSFNQALSHLASSSTTTIRPPEGLPKFDHKPKSGRTSGEFFRRSPKVVNFSFIIRVLTDHFYIRIRALYLHLIFFNKLLYRIYI